jgi:hypothetical protein
MGLKLRLLSDLEAQQVFGVARRYISAEEECRALKSRALDLAIEVRRLRAQLRIAKRWIGRRDAGLAQEGRG